MTGTLDACSCGAPMVPAYDGKAAGCTHCDQPCAVKGCDPCRRLAQVRR